MKNQNDWIVVGVAFVLALGASAYFLFGARKPVKPAEPDKVPTAAAVVPQGNITMATSLPGGGGGGGMAGGGAGSKWANMGSPASGKKGGPAFGGMPGMGGPGGRPMPSASGVGGGK